MYAARNGLLPFRRWITITHESTYIHRSFEFSTVRGRKTRYRIDIKDWNVLLAHKGLFHNPLPKFDIPSFPIHIDSGIHTTHHSKDDCKLLCSMATIKIPLHSIHQVAHATTPIFFLEKRRKKNKIHCLEKTMLIGHGWHWWFQHDPQFGSPSFWRIVTLVSLVIVFLGAWEC